MDCEEALLFHYNIFVSSISVSEGVLDGFLCAHHRHAYCVLVYVLYEYERRLRLSDS